MTTSRIVTYRVDDETIARFEVVPEAGFTQASGNETAGHVRDAVEPSIRAARVVLDRIKALQPDGVELTFGIKVTGTANWIVAKAASECTFEVTLKWQQQSAINGAPDE